MYLRVFFTLLMILVACPLLAQVSVETNEPSGDTIPHSGELGLNTNDYPNIRITTDNGDSKDPAIDCDANYCYLVWEDNRDGNSEIYFTVVTPDGVKQFPELNVSNSSGQSVNPDVSVDASGNVFVAWTEGGELGTLKVAVLNDQGEFVLTPLTYQSPNCRNPELAAFGNGLCNIVYEQSNIIMQYYLYWERLNVSGTRVCGPRLMSNWEIFDFVKSPTIASYPSGECWTAWHDIYSFQEDIRLAKQNANCSNGPMWLLYDISNDIGYPSITLSPGFFWLNFEDKTGSQYIVRNLRGEDDACQIAPIGLSGSARYPSTGTDNSNGFVAWQYDEAGTSFIYVTQFYGCAVGFQNQISDGAGLAQDPDIYVRKTNAGEFFVVWQDNRNGNWDIYFTGSGVPPPITILVLDGADNPISDRTMTLFKLVPDYIEQQKIDPRLAEEFSVDVTTDANGTFVVPDGFEPGHTIGLRLQIHTEESGKHPPEMPNLYSINVDNGVFDNLTGDLLYQVLTGELEQVISLNHTTIVYELVVSVEWDADQDYLESLRESIMLASNYMYDVTDGQSFIGNLLIADDGEYWDECDIRVHARNDFTPYTLTKIRDYARIPRIWFGKEIWTIDFSYYWFQPNIWFPILGNFDLSNSIFYRTIVHELGHYLWNFLDENKYIPPWAEPEQAFNLGFMDSQYEVKIQEDLQGGTNQEPWASEMSTEQRYFAAPSLFYFYTWQYYFHGMSCWNKLESDFEGQYDGIEAAILKPSERFPPGGPVYFFGPNNTALEPNVNVGAMIAASAIHNNSTGGKTLDLLVNKDNIPQPRVSVRTGQSGNWLKQGKTGDVSVAGRMLCLGVRVGDKIKGSGFSQTVDGETWMSGSAVIDIVKGLRSPASPDLELALQALSYDLKALFSAKFNANGSVFLHVTSSINQALVPEVYLLEDSVASYAMNWDGEIYTLTWPAILPIEGTFVFEAVGDSGKPFFIDCGFRRAVLTGSLLESSVLSYNGTCEIFLDTLCPAGTKVLVFESRFPSPTSGLESGQFCIGAAYSLSLSSGTGLCGTDNYLILNLSDADFPKALQYPGWQRGARIYRWDEILSQWSLLGGDVDTLTDRLSVAIDQTGIFAAFTEAYQLGKGRAVIQPDPQYWFYIHTITPMVGTIFLGDLEGRTVDEINPSAISINGTISPDSFAVLPTYPGFTAEVMACYFNLKDFILGYGLLWDTTVQTYTVTGQFDDGVPFLIDGEVTMFGHTSGDVNGDGRVNVADLTYLVDFLFNSGAEPPIPETADLDHNGAVNVADVAELVRVLF